MPVIIAKLTIDAAEVSRYLAIAAPLVETTQHEPGCNVFTFTRDARRDDMVWVIEDWETEAAMRAHQAADHVKAFLRDTADFPIAEMRIKQFTVAASEWLA